MNYLVTGGAGHIGTHLTQYLLMAGHRVTVLDLVAPTLRGDVRVLRGDVRDPRIVSLAMRGQEGVFHLAAVVGFARVMPNLLDTITTNTAGTELVLQQACLAGAKVLLASTSACYGRVTNGGRPVREGDDGILGPPTTASWAYAYAKAVDECLAFAYAREHGLPVVVTRLFNVVGPGQSAEAGFVLPRFVQAACRRAPLEVHAPGTQQRTFVDVRDVVAVLAELMLRTGPSELYNVGGVERLTIRELAQMVCGVLDSPGPIVSVDAPYVGYDNVTDRQPDLTRLHQAVGMRTYRPLTVTIRDMAEAMG